MYRIVFSKKFAKQLLKISRINRVLSGRVRKILSYLQLDPNHPSIRLHKLKSSQYWSVSVGMDIRIRFRIEKNLIFLVKIGTHDEIY